jgi:Uma2 family endonuclease
MATIQALITAEEFGRMPNDGRRVELVGGVVVMMNLPNFDHGVIAGNVHFLLRQFVKQHDLGRTTITDAGVVTKRDPDSVRGPDVAYYSYDRLPKSARVQGYPSVAPDLVFEVLSPGNRWSEMLTKVSEYLQAGVRAVSVLEPESKTVQTFRPQQSPQHFAAHDQFSVPDVLAGWLVNVAEFFEL